jgi:hypothetical protein
MLFFQMTARALVKVHKDDSVPAGCEPLLRKLNYERVR